MSLEKFVVKKEMSTLAFFS